jgi:hypothetical protein
MVLGWFLIRPYPYPEYATRTRMITESDNHGESNDTSLAPNETTQLIGKDDHTQHPNITGLALIRAVDFWILFCIMSLCKYSRFSIKGAIKGR